MTTSGGRTAVAMLPGTGGRSGATSNESAVRDGSGTPEDAGGGAVAAGAGSFFTLFEHAAASAIAADAASPSETSAYTRHAAILPSRSTLAGYVRDARLRRTDRARDRRRHGDRPRDRARARPPRRTRRHRQPEPVEPGRRSSALGEAGCDALAVPVDVRDPAAVDAMVARTVDSRGRIDMLVNNAAGNFICRAEDLSPNGWNAVIGIVLNGSFYCSRAVGRHMIARRAADRSCRSWPTTPGPAAPARFTPRRPRPA